LAATGEVESATHEFLSAFNVIALDGAIAERAVTIRRDHHVKLPDAIIRATAQAHAMLLVTRNTKDFKTGDPGVRMPYKL
jgi:predicted nucleic acid-binding protein